MAGGDWLADEAFDAAQAAASRKTCRWSSTHSAALPPPTTSMLSMPPKPCICCLASSALDMKAPAVKSLWPKILADRGAADAAGRRNLSVVQPSLPFEAEDFFDLTHG